MMNTATAPVVESSLLLEKKRNYGIDLLRIISMFLVVCMHVLGKENILDNLTNGTWLYYSVWLLYTLAYPAVNCYALISGYVGYTSHHKYSNIINLHFQVWFYSFLGFSVGCVMSSGEVGVVSAVKALFPVRYNTYWYYTAYFCLFFFMPLLNKIFEGLNKASATKLVVSVTVIYSILPTVYMRDFIGLSGGYSFLWLLILYIIGVYVRKYRVFEKSSKRNLFLWLVGSLLVTWLSKVVIELISETVLGVVMFQDLLFSYISPTVLLSAVLILGLFSKVRFKNSINKLITFIAPLTFGIYLLHENPFIRSHFVTGKFAYYLQFKPIITIIAILGTVVAIFLIGLIVEFVRQKLFKLIRVNKLSLWIEGVIACIYRKVFNKKTL
ncbi:MAG: acyltransferase [Ruminococcus sp.]|nr:acyltransferase [Ruminococcus sp.]